MYTIYDVASEAGVSTATVSRVLNGTAKVSDATSKRVMDAVRKLDFHPSLVGQALNHGAGRTILMIVPLISSPVLSLCIKSVAREINASSHTLLMAYYDNDKNDILESQRDLMDSSLIKGIIYQDTEANIPRFSKPAVIISEQPDCDYPYCVVSNDRKAMDTLTSALIAKGICRIAFISLKSSNPNYRTGYSEERFKGVLDALDKSGIPFNNSFHYECRYSNDKNEEHSIYQLAVPIAEKIASLPESVRPEAVICATDSIAYACTSVFQRYGLRIPYDISVTGYDNSSICFMSDPPLTSVQSPFGEFGTEASKLLLSLLEPHENNLSDAQGKKIIIDPIVHFRGSTPV